MSKVIHTHKRFKEGIRTDWFVPVAHAHLPVMCHSACYSSSDGEGLDHSSAVRNRRRSQIWEWMGKCYGQNLVPDGMAVGGDRQKVRMASGFQVWGSEWKVISLSETDTWGVRENDFRTACWFWGLSAFCRLSAGLVADRDLRRMKRGGMI